ncbi:uncharacterized protein CC84DRAFT_598208 [Paraphaeosphaeria sporulosa]|uniref:C2H2-type domain-containing protein n=1 Tax=Paraphaeosphaeria sporulosa TaxID=1460663 RepID=A0A177CPY2_9PLEO|nr:uncharacterized protein CC84DRAFT_598208 [Paraphaeosphaeria sporulosa]OAG08950.1 hypothetical protein CC84DRAFT_598208 [Paraphaeosphaeria sporulosa]
MAQPNENPAIQYIGADGSSYYFDPQEAQAGNEYHSQWRHPGPVPAPNTPSPSGSHSTVLTAPVFFNGHQAISPSVHPQDGRMSNNLQGLSHLAVPSHSGRPRSTIGSPSDTDHATSPIYSYPSGFAANTTGGVSHAANLQTSVGHGMTSVNGVTEHASSMGSLSLRMYSNDQHSEPWNPMRAAYNDTAVDRASFPGSHMKFGPYRQQQISDMESVVGPRSDSGYFTHPAPQSVISNELERADQDLPTGIFEMSNLNVNSAPSESTTEYIPPPSDQASVYSGRSQNQGKSIYLCSKCKEVSKCPSDYKKHMLKHDKPHTCDVQGCRRAAQGKGFTTINDLQRHKKSVHRIGVERDSYQCASEHCRNRGKIWPRLDNFKQHISRMHRDEDEADLIRKSSYRGPMPPSTMSQADMLAGIGIEAQAAGNELDDPASLISLTPDQDENPWAASFDSGSHKYALDNDRTTRHEGGHFLKAPDFYTGAKSGTRSISPLSSTSTDPNMRKPRLQNSLKMLADDASTQSPTATASLHHLSSAPQTKAEQQRQLTHAEQQCYALQKFGKALIAECQADPSVDGTDLGNVVLRILSGTSQRFQSDKYEPDDPRLDAIMTKTEALKASQAISNLIKHSRNSPSISRPRRSSRGSSSDRLQCTRCEVTLARACDMKKHMKRHTKPYGCTYPKCHKRFGAKSDWKRHENSQHFQLESFRCQRTDQIHGGPCGELFQRVELFKQHIVNEHRVAKDSDMSGETKACLIGKNYQRQFWCGFCQKIVKLKERRNAAWDERFNHIDAHFSIEKRGIELWMCVETRKTKGELLREMDRTKFDDDDGDEDGDGEPDDSPPPTADGAGNGLYPTYDAFPRPPSIPPPVTITEDMTRKRQYPADDDFAPAPTSKRRRTDVNRYCCSCGNGPWQGNMYVMCMDCNHHLCSSCPADGVVGGLDGGIMLV